MNIQESSQFENILIHSDVIDKSKTAMVRQSITGDVYDIYLKLSQTPNAGWKEVFEKIYSFPSHSMWRRVAIKGDCIVIQCSMQEFERYHYNVLKATVETANSEYRQLLDRQLQNQKEQEQIGKKMQDDQKREIDAAVNRLKNNK